jgi:hypothetical protein
MVILMQKQGGSAMEKEYYLIASKPSCGLDKTLLEAGLEELREANTIENYILAEVHDTRDLGEHFGTESRVYELLAMIKHDLYSERRKSQSYLVSIVRAKDKNGFEQTLRMLGTLFGFDYVKFRSQGEFKAPRRASAAKPF